MDNKLYIKTFGCQMNEYDSEKMAAVLRDSHGYELTDRPEEADLLLVNTCSIREKAQALFISLARTEGIPARFDIGFPVPESRSAGTVDGYHCWVNFYLPGSGWIPIDASEAFKHPERRELFYGTHPADRIHFTTGRDLRLGTDHRGPPLNYFVYPYVEVDGVPYEGEIGKSFAYSSDEEFPQNVGPSPAR